MKFFSNDSRTYITPAEEIKFYRAAYPLPSKLIYTPFVQPGLPRKNKKITIKELPRLYQGTHLYCINDDLLYFQGLLGAPATGIFLEELIALGVKELVFLGLAGAIQQVKTGDRIIVTEAVRLEGTSYHYLPDSDPNISSEELTRKLTCFYSESDAPFMKGKICSTDAPFRETFQLIEELRQKNVLAIEMEISVVFAIAAFRHVQAAALVIISDELKNEQWSRFQSDQYLEAFVSSFDHLVDFFSRR
ncbi:MAG: nucleoside phosphorylase [Candidatus Odinarchaeota archaeon]